MAEKVVRLLAAGLLFGSSMFGQSVRVLCSNGIKSVFEEVLPRAEKAIGRKINVEYSSSASLKDRIDKGETFDVTILTPDFIDDLIQKGKAATGSRVDLARGGIGVGVKAGTPKPDIHDAAAMKQTLLKVKSVTYTKNGASRSSIEKMYERLGITAQMQPKVILEEVPGRPQYVVAEGGAEMVITLISEIMPTPGVLLVGPLPGELQNYVSFAGGIGAKAVDRPSGQALLKFLSSKAVAPTYKAKGLEAR